MGNPGRLWRLAVASLVVAGAASATVHEFQQELRNEVDIPELTVPAPKSFALPAGREDVVDLEDLPTAPGDGSHEILIDIVNEYARRHPDVFAGLLVSGPHLYVGFTDDAENHLARMRSLTHDDTKLRVFQAPRSLRSLEMLQTRITDDTAYWGKKAVEVSAIGVDIRRNLVSVMLADPTQRIRTLFVARYGPNLAFEKGTVALLESRNS